MLAALKAQSISIEKIHCKLKNFPRLHKPIYTRDSSPSRQAELGDNCFAGETFFTKG